MTSTYERASYLARKMIQLDHAIEHARSQARVVVLEERRERVSAERYDRLRVLWRQRSTG